MPTISPQTTPYYGGGQVVNPANVIPTSGAPSNKAVHNGLGTLAVDNANAAIYGLVSLVGGVAVWTPMGGGSLVVSTLTGDSGGAISPSSGNINLLGTANQIKTTGSGSTITWSLPNAVTAPGSLTTTTTLAAGTSLSAGTTITATLGNITATNGNLALSTAGNKIVIATGSNASVGTSAAMSGTPGAVTVATTACSATAKVFYSRATAGGSLGNVSITAQDGTGFTLTSTANETSTFNWWIINN